MRTQVYESAQASLLGNREINQDRCTLIESGGVLMLALADGMGGHPKGELAAELLIDTCEKGFREAAKPIRQPRVLLGHLVHQAHERIIAYGKSQHPPIDPRTTAVVSIVQDGIAHWVHVGDSRLYLFRNGRVQARTEDHSYVQELRQQGIVGSRGLETHPLRNYVTRCVGGTNLPAEISHGTPITLESRDVLLMCTDGLWTHVDENSLATAVSKEAPLSEIVSDLSHDAETKGYPESDNVTAVAIRWLAAAPAAAGSDSSNLFLSQTSGKAKMNPADHLEQAIDDLKQAIEHFESEMKEK